MHLFTHPPLALSLSKGCPFLLSMKVEGQGFDKLSPNGLGFCAEEAI